VLDYFSAYKHRNNFQNAIHLNVSTIYAISGVLSYFLIFYLSKLQYNYYRSHSKVTQVVREVGGLFLTDVYANSNSIYLHCV